MKSSFLAVLFSSALLAGAPLSARAFHLQPLHTINRAIATPTRLQYITDSNHDQEVILEGISLTKTTEKPTKEPLPLLELKPGDHISGTVVRLLAYGALVQTAYDIPGKTPGCVLLHKDRCSFQPKVGQTIPNARVSMVNREKNAVTISTLARRDPRIPLGALQEGDEVQGRVRCVKSYGVFVDVGTKRDALLHSSQMEDQKLREGDFVTVQVVHSYSRQNRGISVKLVTH